MPENNGAKEAMQEQMRRVVDISPYIKDLLEGKDFPYAVSDTELDQQFDINNSNLGIAFTEQKKALAVWDALKIERNTYLAIFIEEAWKRFEKAREEFSYDERAPFGDSPILQLSFETGNMFSRAIKADQAERLRRLSEHELVMPQTAGEQALDRAYARYMKMIAFGTRNRLIPQDSAHPSGFIERGVGTAMLVTWSLMDVVPRLAKRAGIKLSPEEIERIIVSSYGQVVGPFMSMDLEVSPPILKGMSMQENVPGFKLEYFDLVEDPQKPGTYKLKFHHEKLMDIVDGNGEPYLKKIPRKDTTMCPSRYALSSDPSGGYFRWSLSLAKKVGFPSIATLHNLES